METLRRWAPAALAVVWGVWILVLSLGASRRLPGLSGDLSERVQHFVAFAILGALVMLAITARRPTAGTTAFVVFVALVGAGFVGEMLQRTTTDRQFSLLDIGMDALGAATGIGGVLAFNGIATMVLVSLCTVALLALSPFTPEAVKQIPLTYPEDCSTPPPSSAVEPEIILDEPDLVDVAFPHRITSPSVAELREQILATNELSIETWFSTADLAQTGPVRVFTISDGPQEYEVNLHIGVEDDDVSVRLRTSCNIFKWVGANDVLAADTPQHVLVTWRDATITTWVNGVKAGEANNRWGDFERWDPDFEILVGDEVGGDRRFDGIVYSVTMWNAALDDDTIVARSELTPS